MSQHWCAVVDAAKSAQSTSFWSCFLEITSFALIVSTVEAVFISAGFAIAVIELDEDLNDYNLPLGVQGQAATLNYEHDILHVSMMRRILLRMMSWLKYIYPVK